MMQFFIECLRAMMAGEWAGSKLEPYADEYWWEWNHDLDTSFFEWIGDEWGDFSSYDDMGDYAPSCAEVGLV
jgi:hypothetical protein